MFKRYWPIIVSVLLLLFGNATVSVMLADDEPIVERIVERETSPCDEPPVCIEPSVDDVVAPCDPQPECNEPQKPPKPATFDYQGAIDDIRIDELQMHLAWLADRSQEGRSAGTEAGHRAGDYLATQLALLDLEPAGTDGNYLQGFRFSNGQPRYRNVLGIIRGGDPELADEYVMICAHYDHVGVIRGSVFPGANDNASGTSMILELAESFQKMEPRPKRSILVAFWDAEEKGLFGSQHFADNPTVSLKKIKIVFNFDMVGTLQNNSFEIFGSNAAGGTRELISRLISPDDPDVDFSSEYLLASDHSSFYAKKIPSLMFFTGLDCPYHTPEDTFDIINFEGMKQIGDLAFRVVHHLADADDLDSVKYVSPRQMRNDREKSDTALGFWATTTMGLTFDDEESNATVNGYRSAGKLFGSLLGGAVSEERGGLRVTKADKNSCAEKLGFRRGDRIMTLNGRDVEDHYEFDEEIIRLLDREPDGMIYMRVARPRESKEWLRFEISPSDLDETSRVVRRGFLFWESDAEPDTLIVGSVFSERTGESGLVPGDRIMHINDERASGETLNEALKTRQPVSLEIERNGKISRLDLAI